MRLLQATGAQATAVPMAGHAGGALQAEKPCAKLQVVVSTSPGGAPPGDAGSGCCDGNRFTNGGHALCQLLAVKLGKRLKVVVLA
jgi:hypothetical protein